MKYSPKLRKAEKTFLAVDSHTMGEPTRIILQGFPELQGKTMMDRKKLSKGKLMTTTGQLLCLNQEVTEICSEQLLQNPSVKKLI